ncbi:MAG: hypothetical protein JWQ81_8565 [Amycolatopsis sp.]|uniref:hypothetical protein n=1 Tax=Amycolatopsis sp. TaxID=37632 RepID=UPI00261D0E9C|nr:hypothetical protein [Amycolatopsis sp.]MCU1687826.1 hypothetical protein [Amycolatopsis sp.]
MTIPTPAGGSPCVIVLGGITSTLILATCGALAPAGVPLAVRALLFVAILGVVGVLVAAAFRLAATTPVPVQEEAS